MNATDKIMALAEEFSAAACHVAHYDADRTTILPRSDAVQLLKQKHDTLRTEIEAVARNAERWRKFLATRPAGTHAVINEAIDATQEKQS